MRIAATLLLLLSSFSLFAQEEEQQIVADRPGLADGAATVGAGVVQLETGLMLADDGDPSQTLPTLLRFGISDRFELRVQSDVVGRVAGDTELAPIAAGFKLRLREGAIPLSLIASVQPPSGGGAFRTTDFAVDARVVSDIDLGNDFSLTPNAGLQRDDDGTTAAVFAMSLEKEVGDALPFVDFETTFDGGEASLIADAGVAWIVRPNTQLDVSAGGGLAGDGTPDWFISAGYSRRF
ncbi:MAG TPA: transporter [Thermoanaerobaculia bacterium]|nr:transporter [Thermoanaerobaculia bacterium]